MRKMILSILLAGAAASPAIAQDHGRWHNDEAKGDRAQARAQNQQQHEQQSAPAEVRQQRQSAPAEVRQQRGGFEGRRFEGRNNGQAQVQVQQQAVQHQQQQVNRAARSGFEARQREQTQQWQGRQDVQSQQWQGRQGVQTQQRQGRNGSYGQRSWSQSGQASQGSRWSGNWNRDWRNDSRYDWRRYRNSHRSLFSIGIYYDPFGYNYRPFDIGYRLQSAYFGQQYWIDPAMYELPYPPPGTTWVRYWNDALLVDMYSGQVVDVIHDFFW